MQYVWACILRSSENTPAQLALLFEVDSKELFVGRLERPRMNIFSVLINDLRERNLSMNNREELIEIRDMATGVNLICMGTDYKMKLPAECAALLNRIIEC